MTIRDRSLELSKRQSQVLALIEARMGVNTRDLASALCLSIGHAHSLCTRMRRRGLLWKGEKRGARWGVTSTAIELLDRKPKLQTCQHCKGLGRVRN